MLSFMFEVMISILILTYGSQISTVYLIQFDVRGSINYSSYINALRCEIIYGCGQTFPERNAENKSSVILLSKFRIVGFCFLATKLK